MRLRSADGKAGWSPRSFTQASAVASTRRFAVAARFATLPRMAKAKSNESVRVVGAKHAFAAQAVAWPALPRRFCQIQTLRRTRDPHCESAASAVGAGSLAVN